MTDDERILWGVVANARRVVPLRDQRRPLWGLVSDATGCGSTSARTLCRRFGFVPDSTSAQTDRDAAPATEPPTEPADDYDDVMNLRYSRAFRESDD